MTDATRENFTQKIYTKQGIVKENVFGDAKILHLGSGSKVLPGATTIDLLDLPGVDVVHNLDECPWPFPDNSFDLIFGHNVFEHLTDMVAVMDEVHRILKPGGRVVITVPYFRCTDAFVDPTHKIFFTSRTFDYFLDTQSTLSNYQYSKNRFKKIGFWYGWPRTSSRFLARAFKNFISRHNKFYDSHLSLLFPVKIVVWELEVIKNSSSTQT